MKHGKSLPSMFIKGIIIVNCRPSLFDDFVEYELARLKKLELMEQQQDDSNNNIKISPNGEPFNNTLHAN